MCRYGHLGHLNLLLDSFSEESSKHDLINRKNATGNTALHVCALYNQELCLLTLLKHNADINIRNYANQDPSQVVYLTVLYLPLELVNHPSDQLEQYITLF